MQYWRSGYHTSIAELAQCNHLGGMLVHKVTAEGVPIRESLVTVSAFTRMFRNVIGQVIFTRERLY